MPPHLHYVEPYAGGLSVLLAHNPENCSEVVNDLDSNLTNFWCVLQSETLFEKFKRKIEATPFSEWEFKHAKFLNGLTEISKEPDFAVEQACWFFVVCRQSLAGRQKSFTPITKTRTRRGMNNEVSAWLTAIEGLPEVHNRLKRVLILNRPALEVIEQQDSAYTLHYLDPPYAPSTRVAKSVYNCEMSYEDHEKLLKLILNCKGHVMISGYLSDLYEDYLGGWRKVIFKQANHASGAKIKKIMEECIWCNF